VSAAERAGRGVGTDDATRPTPLLPGSLADGRYRVLGRLGVGGMGLVVRARDELLGRDVAVKILADNLSMDEGARSRFLQEGRAAAAVSDPRVVGVHDVGEEDGRPYLVMECVEGPSLAEILAADGPLPGDEVLDIAIEALAGLGRAHEAGLLHRDVKPGNLLRAPDGTIKVTDFGIAIAVDGDRMTRTGFVIGTAAYLAPERRRGASATVRTDLWALGATLTELLTGEPPGPAADAILAELGDALPTALRRLLGRLLAADPEDRPADAFEALELLVGGHAAGYATTPAPQPDATRTVTRPALPGTRIGRPTPPADGPDEGSATALHTTDAPRRRWPALALAVAAALIAGLALVALTDVGRADPGPSESFGPILIDPADPAATVRELGEQLRERAAD
jgi:eukaryotic-like serine/threonine-protein kinase